MLCVEQVVETQQDVDTPTHLGVPHSLKLGLILNCLEHLDWGKTSHSVVLGDKGSHGTAGLVAYLDDVMITTPTGQRRGGVPISSI